MLYPGRRRIPVQPQNILRRQWLIKIIALRLVALPFFQEIQLLVRFYAFRNHVQLEVMRHADDRIDKRRIFHIDVDVAREILVDLQRVNREQLQITQRRIARSEIVDRQMDAHRFQFDHRRNRTRRSLDDAFGQFQLQILRLKAGFSQSAVDQVAKIRLRELARRNVDGDAELRQPRVLPGFVLQAGVSHNEFAELDDRAGFFRNRDELTRRNRPHMRMHPADERFHADDRTGFDIDLRLVVDRKLAAVQAFPEADRDFRTPGHFFVHVFRKELVIVLAFFFHPVQGKVRIFDQRLGVLAVGRVQADAD